MAGAMLQVIVQGPHKFHTKGSNENPPVQEMQRTDSIRRFSALGQLPSGVTTLHYQLRLRVGRVHGFTPGHREDGFCPRRPRANAKEPIIADVGHVGLLVASCQKMTVISHTLTHPSALCLLP